MIWSDVIIIVYSIHLHHLRLRLTNSTCYGASKEKGTKGTIKGTILTIFARNCALPNLPTPTPIFIEIREKSARENERLKGVGPPARPKNHDDDDTRSRETRKERERREGLKGIPTIYFHPTIASENFSLIVLMHGDREFYLKNHGWWVRFLQEPQHHCERDGVSLFARGDLWRCLWIGKLIICMYIHTYFTAYSYLILITEYISLLGFCLPLRSHRSTPRGRLQPWKVSESSSFCTLMPCSIYVQERFFSPFLQY